VNVVIAYKASYGAALLRGFGLDPKEWRCMSYGDSLMALAPDRLVILRPFQEEINSFKEYRAVLRFECEELDHMRQRAKSSITLRADILP
jgi:hypothetical protein